MGYRLWAEMLSEQLFWVAEGRKRGKQKPCGQGTSGSWVWKAAMAHLQGRLVDWLVQLPCQPCSRWALGCVCVGRWLPVFLELLFVHTLGLQRTAAFLSSAKRENKEVLPCMAPGCCISSEPDQKCPELSLLLSTGISCDHSPRIKMCCLRKHSIPAWCEATVFPGIHTFLTEAFAEFIRKNNPSLLIAGFNLPHPCHNISSGCQWGVKETSRNKNPIK